ncbi:MAG: DMT family transporter [Bacteroidota bacterium]
MSRKNILLATGFVVLWNSGFIGAEYGLPYTGPFTLLFWRYLALAIIMWLYLLIRNRFRWAGRSAAGLSMLIGVLAHGVWLSCVLLALNHDVPAGIVALVVALQPLTTGAFSDLVTGEPTPLFRWLGLFIGFGGVAITVLSRIDFQDAQSIFGYLIPLGSVIAITAASLIQRRLEVTKAANKLPVDLALFYQSFATAIVLFIPAVFAESLVTRWEPEFIYTMAWLVIGVSLGAYALMWLLIEEIDATRVASLFYLGPPVTMLMAWVAFSDTLRMMDVIGLIVVLMGVLLTQLKVKDLLTRMI